ncbi:MAG: nucleotide exchange factor GrpE [Armatimonadota bacterium]
MAKDDKPIFAFAQSIPKAPEFRQPEEPVEIPTLPPDLGVSVKQNDQVSTTEPEPSLFMKAPDPTVFSQTMERSFPPDIVTADIATEATPVKGQETSAPSGLPVSEFPAPTPSLCPALDVLSQQSAETETIISGLHDVTAEVCSLKTAFQREISDQSLQRSSFEKLHREMLDYKENFLQKAMEPLFRQLIGWADHFEEIIRQDNVSKADLSFLYDELIDALDRYGVEQFSADGETFDPSLQKVVKTEPVGDETLNRSIARRVKPGYRQSGRLMRPEQVVAYKYDPSLQVIPAVDHANNEQPIEEVRTDE